MQITLSQLKEIAKAGYGDNWSKVKNRTEFPIYYDGCDWFYFNSDENDFYFDPKAAKVKMEELGLIEKCI